MSSIRPGAAAAMTLQHVKPHDAVDNMTLKNIGLRMHPGRHDQRLDRVRCQSRERSRSRTRARIGSTRLNLRTESRNFETEWA